MPKFPGIRGRTFKLLDGYEIPLFGLGTYTIWDQKDLNKAVDASLASGYRLFDTANFYENEAQLGIAFEKYLPKHGLNREDIFITTKANIRSSNVRQNAKVMVDNSLKSLRTDYLDLVLIHYPKDWGTSDKNLSNAKHRAEMYHVLEEYKDSGKIRSIGVSNFENRHIDELWSTVKHLPTVNQCEFHPHLTRPEVVKHCKEKGILFQAHTPLAKQSKSLYGNVTIKEIANNHQCSVSQLLLAFPYNQDIGVIPKSQQPERIANNMKAVDIELDDDEILKLNDLNQNKRYSDCDGWNVL